jgi:hypothetical protein
MPDAPATADAAYLGFRLINGLTNLLIAKGLVTSAEMVTLLDELASDMSKNSRAVAQRNVGYVRDAMIPEHKIIK